MRLYFATSNPGKVDDVRTLLTGTDIAVEQLDVEMTEPSVDDLETIARAKVKQAWEATQNNDAFIMADDSGLFVDVLNGFPGPQTAFFDEKVGKEKLLNLFDEDDPRDAAFRTAIACYDPESRDVRTFTGACRGTIVPPRGEGGFGYDPMFLPDGHEKTFAEDMDHKQQVSHRKEAMAQLREWLTGQSR